jgi:23S rRNA (cytidine1920-2'-O)/16S rRNA (cytidine1409-2'-O)-methyltransferase
MAIKAGKVIVDGCITKKPSSAVTADQNVNVDKDAIRFVSQGGFKLEKAIRYFGLDFSGLTVLDAGASTGGFTDCALQYGAKRVFAFDVGSNQLALSLRKDSRVVFLENFDIRHLTPELLENQLMDMLLADLSFISLTLVIPHVSPYVKKNGKAVLLIKPQFEMEHRQSLKRGIVKDKTLQRRAIDRVVASAEENSFVFQGIIETDVDDTLHKNIEYLALFVRK